MKRRYKWPLIALAPVVLIVLLVALAWWWVTSTRGGAEWVLHAAAGQVERLEWESLEGGLARGMVLTGAVFEQDGYRVEAERLELSVRVRPGWPPRARVHWLRGQEIDLYLPPPAEPPPEPEPFEMRDLTAPLVLDVDELLLEQIRIHPHQGEVNEIRRLALSGRYAERLELNDLHLDAETVELAGRAAIGLAEPWDVDLALGAVVVLEDAADGSEILQRLDLAASGPLADLALALEFDGPFTLRGDARLRGLPDAGAMTLETDLAGEWAGWPGVEGRLEGLTLKASGRPDNWRAEAAFDLVWPEVPPARVEARASGDLGRLELEQARILVLDGVVETSGELHFQPTLLARLDVELHELDFTVLYPEWPDQARLSGGLEAHWDGVLEVRHLNLEAPPSPLSLTGEADFDPDSERLSVRLDWASLTWPPVLDDSEPLFYSESGRLRADGTLDAWRAELDALLQVRDLPRGSVTLEADGDLTRVNLQRGELRLDAGGQLDVEGWLNLGDGLAAELSLELSDLDPGLFVPELPGLVHASVDLALGGIEPLDLVIEVRRLDGELRNQPLTGSGGLQARAGEPVTADLEAALGGNTLTVGSADGEAWRAVLDAGRLDHLWPTLSGALSLELDVWPDRGELRWQGSGSRIGFEDYRLAELTLTGEGRWADPPRLDAEVHLTDLDLNPWERLDEVQLVIAGDCRHHELDLAAGGVRARLDMGLRGRLPACLEAPRNWAGEMARFELSETPAGNWTLAEAMPLEVEDGRVRAGPGCLVASETSGRVCVESVDAGEHGRAVFNLDQVPMDLVLLPMDPVFSVTSLLEGQAELAWDVDGLTQVDARLAMGAGTLRPLDQDQDLLEIEAVSLVLSTPAHRSLDARIEAMLEGNSSLVGQVVVPDLSDPSRLELDADARLELPDLGAFNRLVPELDELGGQLVGRLQAAGPLDGLRLNGNLALRDGLLVYAPFGSRIEALNLDLTADETRADLGGSFRAGAGEAEIDGFLETPAVGAWDAGLEISGNELQLTDVSWLRLTASPHLQLGITADRLDLNGRVHIDRARLGLPPGSAERVRESSDVIVIGEEDEEEEEGPLPMRDIAGVVTVSLSNDVRLAAAGAQTRLAGELAVEWQPGVAMPRGRGTIRLEDGSYRAYGQNLDIDRGRVQFTGFPIDNPLLDIEAVRTVFGDPGINAAGVRISGGAQDPDIELFTRPPSTEEKALAYILTGADFDPEAGQGAFSVGFWVLPQLFVSYGLGLFDSGNVLAARYELSRRWGIRAASGERDTGADISYLIDR